MRWISTKRAGLWFARIARWTSRKDRRFTCFCAYGGTTGALLRYAGNLCGVSRETNGGYGYRSSFELTPVGGFELATPSPEEENGPLVAYEDGSDLIDLPASEDCYQTTMSSWNRRPTVEMRLHDEESGFSPSSVHMPCIKKGQLIHRFDMLRQNVLCVWAIALSASEQVSRETMENNRVLRASTRAVACQRRKTCFAGVGRSRCRSWHFEQELVCGGETHCRDNGDAGSSRGVHHL